MAGKSDKELIEKVVSGDEQAFRALFSRYGNKLGNYIFGISGSRETAEEITQDVFLKIWLNREALLSVDNLGAYLFVVSKNYALNYMRKQIRENMMRKGWEANLEVKDLESDPESITKSEALNTYYLLLDAAVDQLPPRQKMAYLLRKHERLKYAEIAQRMEISPETVKKYLQKAIISITEYVKTHKEFAIQLTLFICVGGNIF